MTIKLVDRYIDGGPEFCVVELSKYYIILIIFAELNIITLTKIFLVQQVSSQNIIHSQDKRNHWVLRAMSRAH